MKAHTPDSSSVVLTEEGFVEFFVARTGDVIHMAMCMESKSSVCTLDDASAHALAFALMHVACNKQEANQ